MLLDLSDNKNIGTFGDYSFLSFNIMKNITSYTGGVLIDNQNKKLNSFIGEYKILSKIDIIKKIIFVFIIQILNSKIFFPLFFKLIKYSHKHSFNFFLKKYRTDFEVKIENKFPLKFSSLMHPFQKKILLNQFNNFKENQILRTKKSKLYYDNLKEIKSLDFPQDQFDKKNIFLEFPIICKSATIKNNLFQHLMDRKIDIKNYYYKNCSEEKIYNKTSNLCLNSKHISDNILMFPVHKKIHEKYQYRIINEIKKASKNTDEKVWELPLWDEYAKDIKSKVADVKNLGRNRLAGTIAGGVFLKEFVNDTPWVHMDIAGTAWGPKEPKYLPPHGATGVAVRLIYNLIQNRIN